MLLPEDLDINSRRKFVNNFFDRSFTQIERRVGNLVISLVWRLLSRRWLYCSSIFFLYQPSCEKRLWLERSYGNLCVVWMLGTHYSWLVLWSLPSLWSRGRIKCSRMEREKGFGSLVLSAINFFVGQVSSLCIRFPHSTGLSAVWVFCLGCRGQGVMVTCFHQCTSVGRPEVLCSPQA